MAGAVVDDGYQAATDDDDPTDDEVHQGLQATIGGADAAGAKGSGDDNEVETWLQLPWNRGVASQ